MSSSVAVSRAWEPTQAALYPYALLTPIKSKSCPTLGQRQFSTLCKEDPLVSKAARELVTTGKVDFIYTNANTTSYCGKTIRADAVKSLAERAGVEVFISEIYIHSHDEICPGTMFLQFTTSNPLPDGF